MSASLKASLVSLVQVLLVTANFCASLKITRLNVPANGYVGQNVWFNCSYDLEEDTLYSIKWYKDSEEFYRFIPSNTPNIMTYDVIGIKINTKSTFGGNLNILITHLNGSGEYRCEVSAEAPSFQTSRRSSVLTVIHEASAQMDLFSKITGKRNFSSSSFSPSDSKTDFSQIQNTNHFSSSSINADNSIYNSHNSKSSSHQVNTNNNKRYQSSSIKENSLKSSNNNITPNDGHFDENNSNGSTSTFNFISQVLPSSIACCWKLIAAIFTLVFVTIIIVSCFKICQNYLCSCCCCSCLNCCTNKRPPSPVPMTVSSITASHSLLEANSWEK